MDAKFTIEILRSPHDKRLLLAARLKKEKGTRVIYTEWGKNSLIYTEVLKLIDTMPYVGYTTKKPTLDSVPVLDVK